MCGCVVVDRFLNHAGYGALWQAAFMKPFYELASFREALMKSGSVKDTISEPVLSEAERRMS
jgi:hypothetical protein